jgi:AraC family transcriptional regulator
MSSFKEPLRQTRFALIGISGKELSIVATTQSAGWDELEGMVVEGRFDELKTMSGRSHIVRFVLNGTTMVEWKRNGRLKRYLSEPGSLTILPAGIDFQLRTDRWSRALFWLIEPEWLHALVKQEWGRNQARVEIREAFNHRDPQFWDLGQRLAAQMLSPTPGSRTYAEALNTELAIHLLWNYSSVSKRDEERAERLSDPRLRRVVDYVRSSLGDEISLDTLAEVAGLSTNYFLIAFRRATGKTPHRFLTEQRIARACELLQNPHRSIVDVSMAVGFSSQSHLTTVFRRFLKTTPAAYREEVLNGSPAGIAAGSISEPPSRSTREKAASRKLFGK